MISRFSQYSLFSHDSTALKTFLGAWSG